MEFIIKLSGIWGGIFARLMIPFVRKLYQGKAIKFNPRYIRITIASLLLSTIFTLLLYPKLELMPSQMINFESSFKLFCLSFGFGFGFNSIIIEFNQWMQRKKSENTP